MTVSIDELLKGQPTIIKNKEFFATERYITPFLERFRDIADDFECKAVQPSQMSIERNGEVNAVYNKVLIEASLPLENDYAEVVGMSYAIDTRKPICKFFRGIKENLDSGHLYIDTDQNIVCQELEPETNINFSVLDNLMNREFNTNTWRESLKTMDFDASNDNVNFKLGQWIRFAINFNITNDFGSIKIASQDIVAGYKELFEESSSNFFCGLGGHTDYNKIYSAFSNIIHNGKDIVNVADKTYLLKLILSIV
jgi:hypothetical protein